MLSSIFSGRRVDEELMDELEEALILADLGVECTERVMTELRARIREKRIEESEQVRDELRDILKGILAGCGGALKLDTSPVSYTHLGYTAEMAREEAERCLNCKHRPCVSGCPVNVAIPDFIARIREGDFSGAYDVIAQTNALPVSYTHLKILSLTSGLYRHYRLKRVYFSAYVPVGNHPALPPADIKTPLRREHRLYQADWLLRLYQFDVSEITEEGENLDEAVDPKCSWARCV